MDAVPRCRTCGAENAAEHAYCGACGRKFVPREAPVPVEGQAGVFYCHRHKREPTGLRCGKCDVPICTKCAIIGPAGVRCRMCGRNKVRLRPRGVLHDVGAGVGGAVNRMGARPIWYLWIWGLIVRLIAMLFGRW